jgi:hypothetical protein
MDATTQHTALPARTGDGPRKRTDYRAVRRNAAKAARKLPEWRASVADAANQVANLAARQSQANGAREAAAKALVDATHTSGTPRHVLAASAMLHFYRGEKQTRAVSRIVKELERQVRS